MSQVIRIRESTFKKLQQYGEPLVDTPGSVIDRILTHYEQCPEVDSSAVSSAMRENAPALRDNSEKEEPGIFLAPAHQENIKQTIAKSVPLEPAKKYLTQDQYRDLAAKLDGQEHFNCWAMARTRASVFRSMKTGDYVFFCPRGTGQFTYMARVITKFVNRTFGEHIWSDTGRHPWEMIYVVGDVKHIRLPKKAFVKELGYNPKFPVMGITRVQPHFVQNALEQFGTIEQLVEQLEN